MWPSASRYSTPALLPQGMWALSSLARDQTRVPHTVRQILNHWTTREVPQRPSYNLHRRCLPCLTPSLRSLRPALGLQPCLLRQHKVTARGSKQTPCLSGLLPRQKGLCASNAPCRVCPTPEFPPLSPAEETQVGRLPRWAGFPQVGSLQDDRLPRSRRE